MPTENCSVTVGYVTCHHPCPVVFLHELLYLEHCNLSNLEILIVKYCLHASFLHASTTLYAIYTTPEVNATFTIFYERL
jgi:hypothetical protein